MAAKSQDKVFCGVALLLLASSAGWMLMQNSKINTLRATAGVPPSSTAYVPAGIDAPVVSTSTWPIAPSQTRGAEWVYDVFTPPEIYYDSSTSAFSVTPPKPPEDPDVKVAPAPPFGLTLVRVKPDAFNLQLVGYIGGEGDYRGTFENLVSGETVIGRAGKVFPDLGLTIRKFDVKRVHTASKESMTTITTEATAVVVDNKTGEEITLTNLHRRTKGPPFAILKPDALPVVQYRAGEKFQVADATFTIVKITDEPPSVEVRKEAPALKTPVTKTLLPGISPDPVPEAATSATEPAVASPFPTGN